METGDGALAWRILRLVGDYGEAWARHGAGRPPAIEPGAFRIRLQSEADLEAARFDMLAWEDPHDVEGPVAPYWRQDGIPVGFLDPEAPPLAVAAGAGSRVEGLRLLDGDLVIRIERGGAAVQVRVRGAAPFPDDGGIAVKHFGLLEIPHSMRVMVDFWNAAGRTGPRTGRARRGRISGSRGC